MQGKVAIIGECMLELSHRPGADSSTQAMALSYGGDTLNTAIYLARRGVNVDYVTALGDDNMSLWMIDQWVKEGVGCSLVRLSEGRVPGLYMIQTDTNGERSFLYWRDNSPARELFDDPVDAAQLFDTLKSYQSIYLSGITLALYSDEARDRLFSLLAEYRKSGGQIIFDGNYRPSLWASEAVAKRSCECMFRMTDIALPTIEDEQMLFGDVDADSVITRLQSWGVKEIGLKMGAKGCLIVTEENQTLVQSRKVEVVDTTSAGDSFNAGYLAARLSGVPPVTAAESGHKLASIVIQHRGAIIPLELMPE
jgi:2-dehydro-3-deoxygluconokinase